MYVKRIDNGGVSGIIPNIRLSTGLSYETILSKTNPNAQVTIVTYDLYGNNDYFVNCLGGLKNCKVIINRISEKRLAELRSLLPNIAFEVHDNTHAKIILIGPDNVYLSSQNFSVSDWFQHSVHIKDLDAYNTYLKGINLYEKTNSSNNAKMSLHPEYEGGFNASTSVSGSYTPDYSGITLSNIKGKYAYSVNWNQKLNNIKNRNFCICTQTLPDKSYILTILKKLFNNKNRVHIIANSVSETKLLELQKEFPQLSYHIFDNMHAKIIMYSAENQSGTSTVWLSSQNFGNSGWFENLIMLKSNEAFEYYIQELEKYTGETLR